MKTPYYGKQLEMIKYVISEDIKSKELLPFKRANIPIIGSEAVIDYIIKVFLVMFMIFRLFSSGKEFGLPMFRLFKN